MVREKHQVTKDIIRATETFANSDEGRQRHPDITDDNSRAHASLSLYQSKYKNLVRKFPELEKNYNIKKIQTQYYRYYKTALDHFEELALASDPSFVPPPLPAPRRQRATRTARTTAPAAVSSTPDPASSAEVILLAQSVNTLGQTFADRDAKHQKEQAERDAKYQKEQAERDAKKAEEDKEYRQEMSQIRKDMDNRDAKRAEEDKENRQEMLQIRKDMADRDEKRAEENKSTRDMAAFAIAEVATAKKDIATAKKEREEIRQYIGMDDVPANLFQDEGSVADDLEEPFEENFEVENATANFEIEEVEQPGIPSKNDVVDDLQVPIEENLEAENATATVDIEEVEQPGTPSKNDVAGDLKVPTEENLEAENAAVEIEEVEQTTPSKNDVSPKDTSPKKSILWTAAILVGISAVIFAGIYVLLPQVQEEIKKLFSAAKYNLSFVLEVVLENPTFQQLQDTIMVALPDAVVVKEAVLNCFLALVIATLLA